MKLCRLPISVAALTLMLPTVLFGQRVVVDTTTVSGDAQKFVTPWQKLDVQAKLENPADANSVRALVDEILDFPNSFGRIPPIMREIVEQRLMQAEISYKLGRNPGIPEINLVQIANTLADKFKLPDSARTSLHQVEVLRFGMELSSPDFMTPASTQNGNPGFSPNTADLSPAQATHILLLLITQKMISPDFQLPLEEWEKTKYQAAMDKMLKYKELRDSGQLGKTASHTELTAYTLNQDLRTQIYNAVSKMGLTDGLDLINQAFEIAGISK
jgi:hypothetical protein